MFDKCKIPLIFSFLSLLLPVYVLSGCGEEVEGPPVLEEVPLQVDDVTASVTGTTARIEWMTDMPADSLVEYDTTDGYGRSSPVDAQLTTRHRVELTDLQPNTTYHFRVKSTAADGTAGEFGDLHFMTLSANETGPFLTDITAEPGVDGATIRWKMNESATITVEYGTDTAFGEETSLETEAETEHELALFELQPETTYHYRITAKDLDGNVTTSETFTLTTTAEPKEEVTEINMTARQWEFSPSSITVTEGEKVKLNIRSTDVPHGFGLAQFGINERLNPGQTVTVEFTAKDKGNFTFRCTVNCGQGHNDMNGTLTVKAKE